MPSLPFLSLSRPSSPFDPYTYESNSNGSDMEPPSPLPGRRFNISNSPSSFQNLKNFLMPSATSSNAPSANASAVNTPYPSRPPSPSRDLQYANTSDDEATSPLLGSTYGRLSTSSADSWTYSLPMRRRRRKRDSHFRGWRRLVRKLLHHPLCPTQPLTILLSVILFSAFVLSLTLLIIYILNPDKTALPWRSYCSLSQSFPPPDFESLPPVGVFVGVFSMDSAVERRNLVRSTWAKHPSSRGAERGTERTIVRFILGQPRKDWERRVRLEMETYNDMIILPIAENMNYGKTYSYYRWAHTHAFVPPPLPAPSSNSTDDSFLISYQSIPLASNSSKITSPPPHLAPHDPVGPTVLQPWVRPEFVIKADDDSFVMLAELEARLRVAWAEGITGEDSTSHLPHAPKIGVPSATSFASTSTVTITPTNTVTAPTSTATSTPPRSQSISSPFSHYHEPMIYWGYLVTRTRFHTPFMAGELYALSSPLVSYIATTPAVKSFSKGVEDKQTAVWMKMHPRAHEILWKTDRCWIYNHPRSGTVYSHGFLFPSEVTRVRKETMGGLLGGSSLPPAQRLKVGGKGGALAESLGLGLGGFEEDPSLTHSTVSRFGMRYTPPMGNLTTKMEIEALVEGSALSKLSGATRGVDGGASSDTSPANSSSSETNANTNGGVKWTEVVRAYRQREGMKDRFEGRQRRVGGTIVVHYIKKHEWYLETALAMLEGDDVIDPAKDDSELAELERDSEGESEDEKLEREGKERLLNSGSKIAISENHNGGGLWPGGWTRPRIAADLKISPLNRHLPGAADSVPTEVTTSVDEEPTSQ